MLKPELSNSLAWANAFVGNSVKPLKPAAPVVIYWGTKDTAVSPVKLWVFSTELI